LKKYWTQVESFLTELKLIQSENKSFLKLKKRILKYKDELFEFINFNGIPWNNNNAEYAIKQFAVFRNDHNGTFSEKGLKSYLVLLSIFSTCNLRNINFLDFLMSNKKSLNEYTS